MGIGSKQLDSRRATDVSSVWAAPIRLRHIVHTSCVTQCLKLHTSCVRQLWARLSSHKTGFLHICHSFSKLLKGETNAEQLPCRFELHCELCTVTVNRRLSGGCCKQNRFFHHGASFATEAQLFHLVGDIIDKIYASSHTVETWFPFYPEHNHVLPAPREAGIPRTWRLYFLSRNVSVRNFLTSAFVN